MSARCCMLWFSMPRCAALLCSLQDNCSDCRVVCGPVASSVFLRDCHDCVVVVACQQLRLRDCKNLSE